MPKPNDASRETSPTSSSADVVPDDTPCALCGTVPSLCGGLGLVRMDLPIEHPQFGRPVRCPNYHASGDTARIEKLRELSNLTTYENRQFENFQTDLPGLSPTQSSSLKIALKVAYDYASAPRGWLLIVGGIGCGKTHLAAAIGHERVRRGDTVLFITVPDLLDHLRSTYGPSSEIGYDELFDRLRDAPLLIMDDLGAENPSPWAREKLYQLINHRYSLALPTVVTTNVDLDLLDARLRSRLMDTNLVRQVTIAAPDYRNAQENMRDPVSDLLIYSDMRFESFDVRTNANQDEQRNLAENLEAARVYAQHPQRWLVWMGKYHGCGKTHLAAAIANAFHDSGGDVVFLTVPDLLDKMRRSFGAAGASQYDSLFRVVRDTELLVLDDLGIENETSWAREKLFQILNYRYVTSRPTVITTGVKDLYQLDYRIVTRLIDQRRCVIRQISARDYASRTFNRNA